MLSALSARPTHQPRGARRAFAALGAGLLLTTLAACGDDEPTGTDATEAAPEESAGPTTTVEVFFVGDTPQGPRLFAERHEVDAADPLNAAAALLTSGAADDPDYRTLLPEGSFGTIAHDDGSYLVPLTDDGWRRPVDQTPREARLAVQQLVYTLQSVQGAKDPVVVSHGDGEAGTLFGVDVAGGVGALPQLRVRGLVNVLSPAEGEEVSGSFTARGMASSFEATVPWEVRDASGEVVLEYSATAKGWFKRLYPWRARIDVSSLEPGEYTFVARTDDPSAGEGPGPTEDTRTIVVR